MKLEIISNKIKTFAFPTEFMRMLFKGNLLVPSTDAPNFYFLRNITYRNLYNSLTFI